MLVRTAACLLLATVIAPQGDRLDHADLARAFVAAHGLAEVPESELELEPVLERDYVATTLGAVEILYPRLFLGERERVGELRQVAMAVCDLESKWIEWTHAGGEGARAALADLAELRKALKSAKAGPIGASAPRELLAALGMKEAQLATSRRLAQAALSGEAFGLRPRFGRAARIVLAPTRRDFLQLAAFAGLADPPQRASFWHPGIASWTELWWGDLQVVCLEYPPARAGADPLLGLAMDEREPTGLLQHVVQRAAISLSWTCFGAMVDPAFELGMADELVIEVYGENNVRSGGSGKSSATSAYSVFIPGGASAGGVLPPISADSRWREGAGKDHFQKVLRDSLKAARGPRGEKPGAFQLATADGRKKADGRAPFFGRHVQGKTLPPPEMLSDYMEFFRAYRTCFVWWLREEAFGAESGERFAKLFQRMADSGLSDEFEAVVAEVYALPLSGPDASQDSLEWRFLAWLGG
ncbi:MAG TPA: hypothetical protein VMS76_07940 [Planctomycetota bacterium]|nr:hypothetical protein [Planctomycetota bacterium]